MSEFRQTPFDSIDSAREYVRLLCDALRSARTDVAEDLRAAVDEGAGRRTQALQLVSYKLDRLEDHLEKAGILLNDLRMLRRLLLDERPLAAPDAADVDQPDDWRGW